MASRRDTPKKSVAERRAAYGATVPSVKRVARNATPDKEALLEQWVELLVRLHGPALRELAKY